MDQTPPRTAHPLTRALAWTLSAVLACPGPLAAAPTQIADEPLALPAASVKPNVMLILDDSGSMEQQYTPDFLGRRFGGSNALCFDAGDDSTGTITGGLDNCEPGDVSLMTPEINSQYYNPDIRYFPAVNFDGTSKPSMTTTQTTGWTVVPTDGVSPSGTNDYRRDTYNMVANSSGTQVDTVNLITGYPDRVWCTLPADSSSSTTLCKVNGDYTYPNAAFPYGLTSGGAIKYRTGAPYYYRLATTEYCTNVDLTSCVAGTAATTSHPIAAPVRFCTSSALTDCKGKRTGSYTYPKFTGNVSTPVTPSGGQVPISNITLTSTQTGNPGTITGILVAGVNILAGNIGPATDTGNGWATRIRDAVNANTGTSGYHATKNNNIVTLRYGPATTGTPAPSGTGSPSSTTGTPTGGAPNGGAVSFTFGTVTTTDATTTATVTNASGPSGGSPSGDSISSYTVSGIQLLASAIFCDATCAAASNRNNHMATKFANAINAYTGTSGFRVLAMPTSNVVTITAPAGSGTQYNGVTPNESTPGMAVSEVAFSGGSSSGNVLLSAGSFGGGVDATAGATALRQNVGSFTRTNIVPFQDAPTNTVASTFPKTTARTDCAGTTCTYAEEMTNFANWYAYYRTRMAMAKTAIGRAFVGITDAFRVGFITINPAGDITNRFRASTDFTAGSGNTKDLWYQWLYKQESHGATPLREALARVGRYYGNKTDGINAGMPASPTTLACQPNYAILTTDGYWNGNAGVQLDGSTIGNQDSSNSGFSLRTDARFDGALSGASGTLADVAMYYYKTDLRSDLADQVPTTTKDTAGHQHMTTFTVGMGLAGVLNFNKDYESGGSADFNRLKITPSAGGLDWPVPAANAESTLDDLWHTAVNGRGTFFSAKDPAELATAISETLNSVNARVGAGAAAATSNLQPVAGDNFAFTAQYETVSWIGDIKARTIDLSTGTVSARELWAAATLLDQRGYDTRRILTYDPADTTAGATVQGGPTKSVTSITQTGGVATVTATAHGFSDGALVHIAGATPAGYNIGATITFIDANSFTYAVSSGLATPATGTITAGPAVTQNGNQLKSFCWVSSTGVLSADSGCTEVVGLSTAEMDYFLPTVISPGSAEPALVQTATLTTNGTAASATKERLIDYLRGDTSNEKTSSGTSATDLFRQRNSVMGDIINAQPAYVKQSPFSYNTGNFAGRDPFYQEFRTTGLSFTRKGALYVASNDGFLHAFRTDPDGDPYYQTAGIATSVTSDDTFTGTLSTSPTAGEGSEAWAFVPRATLPRMKRLADAPYSHKYLTDGTPVVGDVCFGHSTAMGCAALANWRTVLVAGLNAGGRGFYALDVTDPDNPKALWELRGGPGTSCIASDGAVDGTQTEDCNIGYSFGNAVIVKLPSTFLPATHAGKWVAIVTSGYNNSDASTGDGIGHLYIVEMQTGKILKRMSTGTGSVATPSGLGRINTWVDSASFDNTALTVYGGDQLGNVWRFQLEDVVGPPAIATGSVTRITTLIGPDGSTAQPITVKPELGDVSGKRVVFIGTGRFLGADDKVDIARQSIYAIKDDMASTTSPTVAFTRGGSHPTSTVTGFVKQTLAASSTNPTTQRTVATVNTVDFTDATVKGWFIDLPDGATIDTVPDPDVVTQGAERVNVDPVLQLGTLVIPSNIPSSDTCVAGGFGWINFLDYKTGAQVPGATDSMASTKIAGSLVVGINVVQLPGGTIKAIVTTADNQQLTKDTPVAPSSLQGRRVSWRELFFE